MSKYKSKRLVPSYNEDKIYSSILVDDHLLEIQLFDFIVDQYNFKKSMIVTNYFINDSWNREYITKKHNYKKRDIFKRYINCIKKFDEDQTINSENMSEDELDFIINVFVRIIKRFRNSSFMNIKLFRQDFMYFLSCCIHGLLKIEAIEEYDNLMILMYSLDINYSIKILKFYYSAFTECEDFIEYKKNEKIIKNSIKTSEGFDKYRSEGVCEEHYNSVINMLKEFTKYGTKIVFINN